MTVNGIQITDYRTIAVAAILKSQISNLSSANEGSSYGY